MSASVQQTDFYHIHNVLPEMTSRINDGLCVCVCVCVYVCIEKLWIIAETSA